MYNFIDTNESQEGANLPSEALNINGEYIENVIEGYRTLSVRGREAHYPSISTYSTGIKDGAIIKGRRYPERTITVKFMLKAASNTAYREAFNRLGDILNCENVQLIFNDEPDKYYIGTPSEISEIDGGTNTIIGEFSLLCTDPFKYSIVEYEAAPDMDESSVLIDYKGTYKAFPTLEADFYSETEGGEEALTGIGDCGFVAFFNESEKIIQLGDPDEADVEEAFAKSQTLVNQTFQDSAAWSAAAQALWTKNSGKFVNPNYLALGDLAMAVASYAAPANPASTSATILSAKSTVDVPYFNYTVAAKTSGRTASTVKVTFTITASLELDRNYFGRGYVLDASVYIAGAWRTVRLKETNDYWRGRTAHTVNISVTVSGLAAATSALTGIKFKCERNDPYISDGPAGRLSERACKNIPISTYTASVPETYYLAPSSFGTAAGKWHGPSITKSIGADASGVTGAENFTLTYKHKMSIGTGANNISEIGGFQAVVSGSDGTVIAGVEILKHISGKAAYIRFYVNGVRQTEVGIDISYNNQYFGANGVQTSSIAKSGNKVTFNLGGYINEFTDDAITDMKATNITFSFEQLSSYPKLSYNGLYWVKFVKNNCDTYKDIPNKFSANDVVVADCKNGKIYLNDTLTPSLGALGNDWEDFYLTPGLNQIGVAYSDWTPSEYAPKFKVRYREVFL